MALTLANIRLAHHELIIPRGDKNRRGRVVYFSRDAREALGQYLQHRSESPTSFLFPNPSHQPLSTRTIQRLFRGYAKTACLNPEYTPHCLRNTFASELLNAGADLVTIQHRAAAGEIVNSRSWCSERLRKRSYPSA